MQETKLALEPCLEKQRLTHQIRTVMSDILMIETLELRTAVDWRVSEYLENRLRQVRERRDRLLDELKRHASQHRC